jgi:hypothetical protein
MEHYAGVDVSLESASLCVVEATGRIVREAKVASEPDVLIGWFCGLEFAVTRFRAEGRPDDAANVRGPDPRTGRRPWHVVNGG